MHNRKMKTGRKGNKRLRERFMEGKSLLYLTESYLDLCLASQLKFVAKIEFPQDLYSALVDVDSVSCVKQIIAR